MHFVRLVKRNEDLTAEMKWSYSRYLPLFLPFCVYVSYAGCFSLCVYRLRDRHDCTAPTKRSDVPYCFSLTEVIRPDVKKSRQTGTPMHRHVQTQGSLTRGILFQTRERASHRHFSAAVLFFVTRYDFVGRRPHATSTPPPPPIPTK